MTTQPRSKGRTGRPWRRIRAEILRANPFCFCGERIDMTLPPGDPMSATVDHVVPLSQGGDPHARSNLRSAHRRCNSARRDQADGVVRSTSRTPALPVAGPAPWH